MSRIALAGNDLIHRLKNVFDSYDFSSIKQLVHSTPFGFDVIYLWCSGINAFLKFIEDELKEIQALKRELEKIAKDKSK
jgi:hypothetical protein